MSCLPGASFRFIHCSDLHIDSPFTGLSRVDEKYRSLLSDSTFRALDRVIDTAVQEKADFIVMAGDVYDSGKHSLRARLEFRDAVLRACERNIDIFMVHGNHDPLNSWSSDADLPDNFHRFGSELETVFFKRDGITLAEVCGISYPVGEVWENFSLRFQDLPRERAYFRIGLLHCNVGSISSGHENYSPCTIDDLKTASVDYWALGHVHNARIINASDPAIVYSGNTQGRHVRESGRKGCYVIDVVEGRISSISFRDTANVLWHDLDIDITGVPDLESIVDLIRGKCASIRREFPAISHVARFTVSGSEDQNKISQDRINDEEMLETLRGLESKRLDPVWIESLRFEGVRTFDRERLIHEENFVSDFLNVTSQIREDPSEIANILRGIDGYRIASSFMGAEKEDLWAEILEDAERTGLARLLGSGRS